MKGRWDTSGLSTGGQYAGPTRRPTVGALGPQRHPPSFSFDRPLRARSAAPLVGASSSGTLKGMAAAGAAPRATCARLPGHLTWGAGEAHRPRVTLVPRRAPVRPPARPLPSRDRPPQSDSAYARPALAGPDI